MVALLARIFCCLALLVSEVIWTQRTNVNSDLRAAGGWVSALALPAYLIRELMVPFLLFSFALLALRIRAATACPAFGPSRWELLAVHGALFACFAAATMVLRHAIDAGGAGGSLLGAVLWILLGAASAITLILAFLPLPTLALLNAGDWFAGLAVAVVSVILANLAREGWSGSAAITEACVKWCLAQLGYGLSSRPGRVGTRLFTVGIAPGCSGYEGMALIFAFSAGWLFWLRREFRFPAALVLIPVGIALSWLFNVARLVALILIGHYGHRDLAMGGFHTQDGWVAFSGLAIGFCAVSRRVPGLAAGPLERAAKPTLRTTVSPASPYLVPFIALQSAVLLTGGAGNSVDWRYPVCIAVAVASLFWYRRDYGQVRTGDVGRALWLALATFVAWACLSLRFHFDDTPVSALKQLPLLRSSAWVAFRIAGAVLVAPLVEELALRGFLMRNIRMHGAPDADFSSADPAQAGWTAIAVSSLSFGLLHGSRWIEGTLAGTLSP
jgi:exosortase E/protease (VPEID-CTERM system)